MREVLKLKISDFKETFDEYDNSILYNGGGTFRYTIHLDNNEAFAISIDINTGHLCDEIFYKIVNNIEQAISEINKSIEHMFKSTSLEV